MKTADASNTNEIAQDPTELDLGYPRVSASWQREPGAAREAGARVFAVRTGIRAGLILKWDDITLR